MSFIEPLDSRVLFAAAGLAPPTPDTTAPASIRFNLNRVPRLGDLRLEFTVTYRDDVQMDPASIDKNDIAVTGPRNFVLKATPIKSEPSFQGRRLKVTYRITVTARNISTARSGRYSVSLRENQVKDTSGNAAPAKKYSTDVDLSLFKAFFARP